jgi:hypothetical protein
VSLVSLVAHQTHFHGGQGASGPVVNGGECDERYKMLSTLLWRTGLLARCAAR